MKTNEILPADIYTVINKTIINETDKNILFMLYQPIIGAAAISLFMTLKSDLDKLELMSGELTHHHLMNAMHLKLNDIEKSREKLEAMGLLKTYFKQDKINHYVYELYSPLSAHDFFVNPLLNCLLLSSLGSKDYERLVNYYKINKIDLKEYKNISKKFSDIFTSSVNNEIIQEDIKNRNLANIEIDSVIDFGLIKASFHENLLNEITLDQKTKEVINKLAFLYGIDNLNMINILRSSIKENGLIDINKLKDGCRNYFNFENGNVPLKLVYKTQPDSLKSQVRDKSSRSKLIYNFENLTPFDFLRSRNNGATPTSRDLRLLETLMVDLNLNPGVVNVLIDYVLMINDNKLNKNYVETIAGQWKRLNLKTVAEAMAQAEKEYRKDKTSKPVSSGTYKKQEVKVPAWFNKEVTIEKDKEASEKIEDILKEFGR